MTIELQRVSADPPEHGSTRDSAEAIGFVFLIIMIIAIGIQLYVGFKSEDTSWFPFIHGFSSATLIDWTSDLLVFAFLFVHVVRLSFGVIFLLHDETFRATFDFSKARDRLLHNIMVGIAFVVWTSLLFLAAVLHFETATRVVLIMQVLTVTIFDLMYYWRLRRIDAEKRWNLLIYIGDAAFVAFVCLEIVFYWQPGPWLQKWFGLAVYTVMLLHLLILMLEVPYTYWTSLKQGGRKFRGAIGQIFLLR